MVTHIIPPEPNMQTPIWIRDCHFNIKRRMTDQETRKFERYQNNVKIEMK